MTLPAEQLVSMCPRPVEQLVEIHPNPRQQEFLNLDDEEAFYGGAAGAAKTVALLLWLKDGIEIKDFSGLFLRRTDPQLEGSPTSPIDFSHNIFAGLGEWEAQRKRWIFPSGAVIRFGHMQHEIDKHNYQGPSFHRICFDETPQFSETQYTYMFSRLRRTVGFPIACGIRAAGNPANNWAKRRSVSDEAIRELKQFTAYDPTPHGMIFDCPGTRGKFVPARVADNPHLEVKEYIDRMRERLSATLAAQLANGDWSVIEGAVIDAENLRYYSMRGRIILAGRTSKDERACRRFATIDTAGTSKQKAAESRGKSPSYSVCAIWDHWRELGLFLRYVWRKQVGWPELKHEILAVLKEWGNPTALIENAHHGQVLVQEIPNGELSPTKLPGMEGQTESAKYDRAVASGLLTMIDRHQFYLPDSATVEGAAGWMPEFESELLGWSGHPDETADQIDVCSHAAWKVNSRTSEVWGGPVGNVLGRRF